MPTVELPAALEELVARQAISEAITTVQRGIDRGDLALLKSAWHGDAQVAYGFFNGPAAELAEILVGGPANPDNVTMHRPANVWIKVAGDRAISESYVFVYSPSEGVQSLIGGRYLDRHERRDGQWRLSHRTYVMDWNINQPATGTGAAPYKRGVKSTEDPGVGLLAQWDIKDKLARSDGGNVEISADLAAQAEVALAKAEIHDLICAQARAVDRGDTALLRSLWAPDATVDVGEFYTGDVAGFCDLMLETAQSMRRMSHTVNNEWIQVDGDSAVAESYVIAIATAATDEGDQDTLSGGRYVDRYQRLNGAWKCSHRTFVSDWIIEQPSTDQRDEPGSMYEALTTRGGLYPEDPIYSFWKA
ncbi:MAG: nuclear transport factor 2 family protein [Gammaproteobacteria bacterium]|nr:nuclear transport factor 2 family protein [Gammaproteobacteria bacterium]